MNNDELLQRIRAMVRAGVVLILLFCLCSLAIATDGELQSMIVGALLTALGVATTFYFKKEE